MSEMNVNEYQKFSLDKDLALKTILNIEDVLNQADDLLLTDLDLNNTVFIVIDMINGFAKRGSLSSSRVNQLIPKISKLLSSESIMNKIFVCDAHTEDSIEFQSYPQHAIKSTDESEIVDELLPYVDSSTVIIKKNSTNAMASKAFLDYLSEHSEIDNYVLIGDCTDICILQCALGLKSHYNELNIFKRVIVPYTYVDTYDLDITSHHGDMMNLFALYNMKINGIELYKSIV